LRNGNSAIRATSGREVAAPAETEVTVAAEM
jgi:hypothetical protein